MQWLSFFLLLLLLLLASSVSISSGCWLVSWLPRCADSKFVSGSSFRRRHACVRFPSMRRKDAVLAANAGLAVICRLRFRIHWGVLPGVIRSSGHGKREQAPSATLQGQVVGIYEITLSTETELTLVTRLLGPSSS